MDKLKVLSLEDDANLAVVMSHYFEEEGHSLTQVNTGEKFLETIRDKEFDVVLVDLGLPDMDGLTLLPQIKQHHSGGIIVVSGKSSTTDRVVGLEMGADDYIVKPFEMRELLARIKANTRRVSSSAEPTAAPQHTAKILSFEDFSYEPDKMMLTGPSGQIVDLTSGECELLALFLKSNGRVLSREYLHEQTRDGGFDTYDRAVDIAVTRLRKKLNDDPSSPRLIKTVRGVGYMFIADVA